MFDGVEKKCFVSTVFYCNSSIHYVDGDGDCHAITTSRQIVNDGLGLVINQKSTNDNDGNAGTTITKKNTTGNGLTTYNIVSSSIPTGSDAAYVAPSWGLVSGSFVSGCGQVKSIAISSGRLIISTDSA